MFLGSREQHNSSNSNRESREGSMGPPFRQSSNASACSASSLHDAAAASSGSQFFEVWWRALNWHQASSTFFYFIRFCILAKSNQCPTSKHRQHSLTTPGEFRAHNEMEEQKVGQTSLPVSGQLAAKSNGLTCHDLRSMFAKKLVDTQEESDESSPAADNKTLAILQQTGQVLQNLHQERIQDPQAVSQSFFKN